METLDRILLWLLWSLTVLGVVCHARVLVRGRLVFAGIVYGRTEHPRDFWFIEATSLVMLAGACLALFTATRQSGSGIEAMLYVFPFVWAGAVAHALWHGWAGLAGRRFRRAERPRAYWTLVAFLSFMFAAMTALAVSLYELEQHGAI